MTKHAKPAKQPGRLEVDEEAKLHNAAGQAWDTERMDRINDADIDALELSQEIRRQAGELKGKHRAVTKGGVGRS